MPVPVPKCPYPCPCRSARAPRHLSARSELNAFPCCLTFRRATYDMESLLFCHTDFFPNFPFERPMVNSLSFGVGAVASAVGGGLPQGHGQVQPQIPPQPEEELQEVEHVRNVFPETWLWANASVLYDPCLSDCR